jgi:transaldolase
MNPATQLHQRGQRIWLDGISHDLLTSGTLQRYIHEFAVSGLTSNPTISDHAIRHSDVHDAAIRDGVASGGSAEALLIDLTLAELTVAADLFRDIHDATAGVDGWASLEVSPLLADDTAATVRESVRLYSRSERPNLFIKIPATRAGMAAIEQATFAGVPVNVTLLFSCEQYLGAAEAYLCGLERRIAAGLAPQVRSVASIFVSRWDVAVKDAVAPALHDRLGIAIAKRTYKAHRQLLASSRWKKLAAAGAWPQRLLWASTGTKDPDASDTLYIEALAATDTINTMLEKTLLAFVDHGTLHGELAADGGDAEAVLAEFRRAGIDDVALADQLLNEGVRAFSKSWTSLLDCVADKSRVPGDDRRVRASG